MAQHMLEEHPNEPFKYNIIQTVKTKGYVDRKACEAIQVHQEPNTINRRMEGGGTINLYW